MNATTWMFRLSILNIDWGNQIIKIIPDRMDNQTNQNCKLIFICPIQAPKSWHSWVWAPWLPCEGHNWLWHRGPASWDEMEGTGSHPVFQICFEQRRQQPIKIELDNLLEKTHTHTYILYIYIYIYIYIYCSKTTCTIH